MNQEIDPGNLERKVSMDVQKNIKKELKQNPIPKKFSDKRAVAEIKDLTNRLLNDGLETEPVLQAKYFSVDPLKNDFDDVKENFFR